MKNINLFILIVSKKKIIEWKCGYFFLYVETDGALYNVSHSVDKNIYFFKYKLVLQHMTCPMSCWKLINLKKNIDK